jgi:hypothetical protein
LGLQQGVASEGAKYCVNKNYKASVLHSPVSEFLDKNRPYICLLDDNLFACKDWRNVLEQLQATFKPFQFKQGLDERLLTEEKCDILFNQLNWIGDYIFAFDNIKDRLVIEEKLKLIRKHTKRVPKFYVFCGFNHNYENDYSDTFWINDIFDLLERIKILASYQCLPYVMRHENYKKSPFSKIYTDIARWCNQPQFFKKMSFEEFCIAHGIETSNCKSMIDFKSKYPKAAAYFSLKYDDYKIMS